MLIILINNSLLKISDRVIDKLKKNPKRVAALGV